ncbi:MAG: GIN domain-containing protein [Flavobacteriaceae bacterium]
MKKIILFLVCICCSAAYGQRKPKIKGNKSVIEVSEDLPAFHGIELKDDLEILLQKSSEPGYTITADDNLIDILKFEIIDSTLVISSFYTITAKKQLDITVRYDELRNITVNDGQVLTDAIISTDQLVVNTLGYSRVELQFSAAVANLNMEGNSKAKLNIDSDSLSMTLKDKIDANIYAVSNTQLLDMQGDALAKIEGSSDTLRVKMSGSTKLRAEQLEGGTVQLEILETASARIHAYRRLELSSSGTAKVFLYGDPVIEIKEFLDSSELYKRAD